MQLTNFHSHCLFCDGRAPMEEYVRYAISKHLVAYGFSSHAPTPFHAKMSIQPDNIDDYLSTFSHLKKKYAGDIQLYVGMEIDYLPLYKDFVNQHLLNYSLDYRIGSIHFIDPLDNGRTYWNIGGDPANYQRALVELYDNDIKKLILRYFQLTHEMIRHGHIDIIGHIDKITDIAEYYHPSSFDPAAKWYTDEINSVFEDAVAHNLIVEVNTKGVNSKNRTFPHQRHFKTMHDLRVKVMVNSDAHVPDLITAGIGFAYSALADAGYTKTSIILNDSFTEQYIQ